VFQQTGSARSAQPLDGEPLRVIYTGRLIGIKNLPVALRAVANAKAAGIRVRFSIVGDGPDRGPLVQLAQVLDLSDEVTFRGNLPHSAVLQELGSSDVYLFPSLKEGGVWSLLEAMAAGLPAICLDTSGMSVITDAASAIRIRPSSREAIVEGISQALIDLARSPARRSQLGEQARRRVQEHFRWEHKGLFMRQLFEELERSPAP
jgi:glycosyltransferase involved in cell wall biosynthesis